MFQVDLSDGSSETLPTDLLGMKGIAANNRDKDPGHCTVDNGGCQHFCFSLPNNQHRLDLLSLFVGNCFVK